MKWCSTSVIIMEIQNKNTLRCMPIIKREKKKQVLVRMWRNSYAVMMEMGIGSLLLKTVHRILKEIKIEWTPCHPIILLMVVYIKENKNINLKRYLNVHVHCSIIFTCWKHRSNQNVHWWMNKENVVHTHTVRIIFNHKKE